MVIIEKIIYVIHAKQNALNVKIIKLVQNARMDFF